jgi:hypothetical protein
MAPGPASSQRDQLSGPGAGAYGGLPGVCQSRFNFLGDGCYSSSLQMKKSKNWVFRSQSIACAVLIQSLCAEHEAFPERSNLQCLLRYSYQTLEALRERFPIVNDIIDVTRAARRVASKDSSREFDCTRMSLKDEQISLADFPSILRAVSYFDLSYTVPNMRIGEEDLPSSNQPQISSD